ncbi:VOC family protein [Pseudolactococcus reticulitermitis]|uniref:VOC domain-containing protein n=1 Tax=Pseudolactococcus reticulitermitis TaxID=2025039 RepID=A0A224XF15_9LACT|nr:VOC family protein [Lactococcus reticulitermitis]GAX48161.1 hypothetical protein RsY01_1776 [Lactococcus reticulitermitis]
MINHIGGFAVKDLERSIQFYVAVLTPLGYKLHHRSENSANFSDSLSTDPFGDFAIYEGAPFPFHLAFQAKDNQAVDAFNEVAMSFGAKGYGRPGYHKHFHENYYAAFIYDPDGYEIEAVFHNKQAH